MAIDVHGGFLISCYYPFRLPYVPAGAAAAELLLDDPIGLHMIMPTNVAFVGEGLRRIDIASLGGHEIQSLPAFVPGASLHFP